MRLRLHAWLLPDLHTIPNNCVRENSLSGYGVGFRCVRSLVRIASKTYISAMHLFICFFVKDFVRKMGARLVQITVPKGDITFRLVASGYRDKPDKIS